MAQPKKSTLNINKGKPVLKGWGTGQGGGAPVPTNAAVRGGATTSGRRSKKKTGK